MCTAQKFPKHSSPACADACVAQTQAHGLFSPNKPEIVTMGCLEENDKLVLSTPETGKESLWNFEQYD